MRPRSSVLPAAALAALTLGGGARAAGPVPPASAASPEGLALAKVSLVERRVEISRGGGRWQSAVEGVPLRIGEALRTGPEAVARLDLPWMSLTVGPSGVLRVPDATVLSATLESGRAVLEAPDREALKLVTGEAEVRGHGRAVVRRGETTTTVSCLAGRFFVAGARGVVTLAPRQGTVVRRGEPPEPPSGLPQPPATGLWPAQDPVYVSAGAPLELRWSGDPGSYVVEVLPVGSDVVLLEREATRAPMWIEVPWEGAFRWRVSARDARGIEGPPSAEGLIAVEAARPE
jgi:hypothetical protein